MVNERRVFSGEFKFKCVLSLLSGEKSMARVCREHGICESVVGRWRDQFMERGHEVLDQRGERDDSQEQRVAALERLVGQLTLQLEAGRKPRVGSSPSREETAVGERAGRSVSGAAALPGGGACSERLLPRADAGGGHSIARSYRADRGTLGAPWVPAHQGGAHFSGSGGQPQGGAADHA